MNIGLLDIDYRSYPNLALMKISAWHKHQGHNVEFANMFGEYDILYKSKIFTYTEDPEYIYNAKKIVHGGTGFNPLVKLPEEIDSMCPDYSLYNCEHAYGFLTRGCPNKCSWCIVPKKEGNIKPYNDINDFIGDHKTVVLMDNNVLASEHGIKQIEKIINMGIKIDFNQGLDAKLIDDEIAKLLSQVKWLSPLRMACDNKSQMKYIKKATELLRKYNCTPKTYFSYVLVKDIDDALERVEFLRDLKIDPFCQPYRDFENNIEPTYIQKQFTIWVNRKEIFKSCTWEEYKTKNSLDKTYILMR